MRNQAGVDGNEVVTRRHPEGGTTVRIDRNADRCSVTERVERDAFGHRRSLEAADAYERVDDEIPLEADLGRRGHVLPTATSAAGGHERARRVAPIGNADFDPFDLAACEVAAFFGDNNLDSLTRQRASDERDAAVVVAA